MSSSSRRASPRITRRTALATVGSLVLAAESLHAQSVGVALATPQRGGTLTIHQFAEPPSLLTADNSSGPTKLVSSKIVEGLLTYDFKLAPQPHLAAAWTASADKRRFTFKLRQGVKWHDGHDFTAQDVAFSIRLVAELKPTGRIVFKDLDAIETPDAHTVSLVFSQPNPAVLMLLSGVETPMLPKHIYQETKNYVGHPANQRPIGTGPYVFKQWVRGAYLELERNPNYWDAPRPYIDRLVFRNISDLSASAAALETGSVDIGYNNPVPINDLPRLRKLPHLGVETRGYESSGDWTTLLFNLENPYLRRLEVRQAIAHSIDPAFVRKVAWYGQGKTVHTPIGESLGVYHTEDVRIYPFDLAKAAALLDVAGLKPNAAGVRFTLTVDPLPSVESFRNVAQYIRQSLAKIGVSVSVRTQEFGAYIKRVYTDREFDIAYGWLITGPDPSGIQKYYWSRNFKKGVPFSNAPGYQSAEMDRLLENAAAEPDEARRIALYRQAQQLIATDLPTLELLAPSLFTVFNQRVHNHTVDADGLQSHLSGVWLAQPSPSSN